MGAKAWMMLLLLSGLWISEHDGASTAGRGVSNGVLKAFTMPLNILSELLFLFTSSFILLLKG